MNVKCVRCGKPGSFIEPIAKELLCSDACRFFVHNTNPLTRKNRKYGPVVLYNDPSGHVQVAIMSVPLRGIVKREIHPHMTQIIRVESGEGRIMIEDQSYALTPNTTAIVPAGFPHEIQNTSSHKALKLVTFYAKDKQDVFEH